MFIFCFFLSFFISLIKLFKTSTYDYIRKRQNTVETTRFKDADKKFPSYEKSKKSYYYSQYTNQVILYFNKSFERDHRVNI